MDNRGVLTVISGFSGAGKGTLVRYLTSRHEEYALSVSATTRQPREGEVEGVHYFFKTRDEFEQMIEDRQLLEYARYVNNYYGTPKEYVCRQLDAGRDVLLEIEIQGALHIREQFPEAILLFVTPPSAADLRERLINRGTEDITTIEARMKRAVEESEGIEKYDYLLINDTVERCAEEMHRLIQAAHARVSNHLDCINRIREELKAF